MDENENGFLGFLNLLDEKPSSTFRFFDRQDYYAVYYDDAELLAKCFYKSMEVVKYLKKGSIPYININKNNSDGVFRYLLINNQYRVEVYCCSKRYGKENIWSLDYTASPGNLEKFQDVLFGNTEMSTSNTLLSINIKKINEDYKVYLGFCDLDNGIFMLGSFEESCNGFDQLTNLTSALFQMNCRECLVPANDLRPEMTAVKNTVQRSGILLTEVKRQMFSSDNVHEVLTKLTRSQQLSSTYSVSRITEIEGQHSLGCLGSVVSYLDLMADDSFYNFFDIQSFKLDNFLRIGEQSSRALNILPSSTDISKKDSLYGCLNSCRTSQGERLLMQWLKQPLLDVNLVNNRLDIVEALVIDNSLRQTLYENYLRRVPDLQRITKRMQRSQSGLQDLYKLYTTLKLAKEVNDLLNQCQAPSASAIRSEFCIDIEEILVSCEPFCELVQSSIDFAAIKDHDYKIKADVDENLMECQNHIDRLTEKIDREYSKAAQGLGAEKKQIRLEVSNNIGYYMRVSRKDEKILRGTNMCIIETLKDGVKFHSNTMQSLNESYRQHRLDYDNYQKSIIDTVMKSSGAYISPLHKLGTVFAKLDVFCSFAITVVSAPAKYVRPKLLDGPNRKIFFKNCRHPIVEMQHNISYIANDVFFDEGRTFQIITGPNMGGKSTYIRSIGLCVIMAQVGCFVPCDEAELTLFDRVMTRIGAGDCILKGVSTFMAEMLDVSWIINTATEKSLIIIDELGRGTSTFDGFGLAWSISEHLITDLRAFSVFATHFHELTDLGSRHSNVVNVHVSAVTHGDSLVFLYKVKEGASAKSYGIEVGRCAGLPEEVLAMASDKLSEYECVEQWGNGGISDQRLDEVRACLRDFCGQSIDNVVVDDIVKCLM